MSIKEGQGVPSFCEASTLPANPSLVNSNYLRVVYRKRISY